MKKPKLEDFKRDVYDGQDYADWYKEYYQALENYVNELEQALRIHDVVGQSEQLVCKECKEPVVEPYAERYGKKFCLGCM